MKSSTSDPKMVVGIGHIDLRIEGNHSLKEKRQVLKKVIERTKQRFNISVAEIGDHELWQRGQIGICVVANDARIVNSMLDKVIHFIDGLGLCEMIDSNFEIIHYNSHGI